MNLKGKVIVITGATGGIGKEIVKNLDKEDTQLILISKNETELQELMKTLKNKNSKYYVCDLKNNDSVEKVTSQIIDENKNINVLTHCAGIGIYKSIEDLTLDDWNESFEVNVTSLFLITKKLLPLISKTEDGLILTIGSGAGVIPMSGRSVYCATKFALRGFILSLAEEFKRINNPKFCLITLGSTLTSFGPLSFEKKKEEMESGKAYFTPEWVGEKLVEIIKDEDREIEYTLYPGDYGFGEWNKPEPK